MPETPRKIHAQMDWVSAARIESARVIAVSASDPRGPAPSTDVEELLCNEADMAFRRRVRTVVELLDAEPDDRILDAGCGHGFYLRVLAELGRRGSVGVEFRTEWLEQGRRELEGLGPVLVRGDVCRLSFADASFDRAILSEVIEHVADDAAALAEAHRVLRLGAVLVVTVPHARYPFLWDPVNKVLETVFATHLPREPLWLGGIWADHDRLYTPELVVERVERAGFRVTDVRKLTHYCIPFAHHLYYGLGKSLLQSGLLPRSLHDAADRFRFDAPPPRRWNPMRPALAMLRAIDRWNDRRDDFATYLNIAVRAVKR